jgi:kanamycin kinase
MSPQGPVELPWIVTEFAAGRPVKAVWRNELGGLTFQVGLGDARQFVKWTPPGSGVDLSAEVVRLR